MDEAQNSAEGHERDIDTRREGREEPFACLGSRGAQSTLYPRVVFVSWPSLSLRFLSARWWRGARELSRSPFGNFAQRPVASMFYISLTLPRAAIVFTRFRISIKTDKDVYRLATLYSKNTVSQHIIHGLSYEIDR